jgi:NTE family protein
MTQIGIVLGAGGVLGGAYHAGALAALEEVTGFDARRAQLLVGTSAGSIAVTSLRAGVPPHDHLNRVLGRRLSPEGEALVAQAGAGQPPEWDDEPLFRLGLPANPVLAARAWLRTGGPRPGVALAGVLPAGSRSTEIISTPLDRMHRGRWPDAPVWIVALRLRDGARVVMGRDPVPGATIGLAAAASSAIPGFFRPVEIDGERYVDGGTHSPTNADLCAGLGLDLVVVVSPMSGTAGVLRRQFGRGRILHARALAQEVAAVRRNGTPVLTIQPTPADRALVGGNPMDPSRRATVGRGALASVRDRLADPSVADRVAILRTAAGEP